MLTTRRVLLLNASCEPLGIVSVPRAIRLVWRGVAEIVELDGDRVLRSIRASYPCPSVVRLVHFIDVRRRRGVANQRTRILMRDRYRCQYCAVRPPVAELTLDHILPRARGGRSTSDNLAASCRTCNNRKGNRTPAEARMPLLSDPAALAYDLDLEAIRHAARERPEWQPYLSGRRPARMAG